MAAKLLSLLLSAALVFGALPPRAYAAPLDAPEDLDALFDGGRSRGVPEAVAAKPGGSPPPDAAPKAADPEAARPGVPSPAAAPERPDCGKAGSWREKIGCVGKRIGASIKEGLGTGSLMYTVTLGLMQLAAALGYVFHPNYAGASGALAGPVAGVITAAVIAPLWEEYVFRHLAFGKLTKAMGDKLGAAVPALVATLLNTAIFVLLHETADPVMIAIRAVGNLFLLKAYKDQGLGASILAHAVFNLSLAAPATLAAMGILPVGLATVLVLALNVVIAAVKGSVELKALGAKLCRALGRCRQP